MRFLPSRTTNRLTRSPSAAARFPALGELGDIAVETLRQVIAAMQAGVVMVADVARAAREMVELAPACTAAGAPKLSELVTVSGKALSDMREYADQLLAVSRVLLPDSVATDLLSSISVEANWNGFVLSNLAAFLNFTLPGALARTPGPTPAPRVAEAFATPLPRLYCASLAWLQAVSPIAFFKKLWNDCAHADPDTQLHAVAVRLAGMHRDILNGKLPVAVINPFVPILPTQQQWSVISAAAEACARAPPLEQGSQSVKALVLGKANEKQAASSYEPLKKLKHVLDIFNHRASIAQWLGNVAPYITAAARQAIPEFQRKLSESCDKVQAHFGTYTLSECLKLYDIFQQFDARMPRLEPQLLELLGQGRELLGWLRKNPDDNNFTTGLEIALSKSEMECPIDLWEPASNGRPGRPDEKKLGMLSSIRAYLHRYIFRASPELPSVESAIELFATIDPLTAEIAASVPLCEGLHVAFKELLDGSGESSAPERLVSMMHPDRRATWTVRFTLPEGPITQVSDSIALDFVTTRLGRLEPQHQSFSQILDFQRCDALCLTGCVQLLFCYVCAPVSLRRALAF
jgi:hypothetical protein